MRVEESVNEKIESALNTTLWEEDESLASGVNFNVSFPSFHVRIIAYRYNCESETDKTDS
jgi:hypothetical protein